MSKNNTLELIEKSRQKDFGAFQELLENHQFMIYKLAFRLLANEEDAKDMVQEVFIRVWEKLDSFDTNYTFSTWIYKIAANMCYDMLKSYKYKKKNRQMVELQIDSQNYETLAVENIENNLNNNELGKIIRLLTEKLSPKQKLVFTLSDIEGMETSEISRITGLTPEKIKSNLYLARKYIRQRIKEL